METLVQSPVNFTNGAVQEIKRLINEPGFDHSKVLRIGVKGGGCSGLSYLLGFDDKMENDQQYESEGIVYVMEKAHEIYLSGIQIDWENGLNNRGFTFNNPNASATCGCGTSFAV
jgi:iron-sulfur cluster assembly accessory protein